MFFIKDDWLINDESYKSKCIVNEDKKEVTLTNGLISRTWMTIPNICNIAFENLVTGESLIRGIKPETKITVDGKEYEVGGLKGQEEYSYFKEEWKERFQKRDNSFQFVNYKIDCIKERFKWRHNRHSGNDQWPPKGVMLTFEFIHLELKDIKVYVNYEIYDGIPLMSKWINIKNNSNNSININSFVSEILAVVENEPADLLQIKDWPTEYPRAITIESDYAFGSMSQAHAARTTHWLVDEDYSSQPEFYGKHGQKTPLLMESKLPIGPNIKITPGEDFQSFRTYELVNDNTDQERRGLAIRKMYRKLAPWVTENPIFMHITYSDKINVKNAIDQCAEVGFEMIILSFGSGLNMENEDSQYIDEIKEIVDYAHSKGIEIGGYSLFSSRTIGKRDDLINKEGAIFGDAPCLCSEWGHNYILKLENFFKKTGMDVLEHDGPYPGDICESTAHKYHKDATDSQWLQWKASTNFYKLCREKGIFINAPDWYFLNGTCKTGMGYKEVNWSLPRDVQILIGRQNIYDGTWNKTPSMGWMFVPLTEYHGGGNAATIEPLNEHLDTYKAHLMNNLGSGVQAIYRGKRLYDTEETKTVVKDMISFYKNYRDILESDIIHVRRPDGRNLDCMLHVNPNLDIKGMAMIFNPLNYHVEKNIVLPLYYTGIEDIAIVSEKDGEPIEYKLDRKYRIGIKVRVEANSCNWFVIRDK